MWKVFQNSILTHFTTEIWNTTTITSVLRDFITSEKLNVFVDGRRIKRRKKTHPIARQQIAIISNKLNYLYTEWVPYLNVNIHKTNEIQSV